MKRIRLPEMVAIPVGIGLTVLGFGSVIAGGFTLPVLFIAIGFAVFFYGLMATMY